jgi:hypothetical protein
VKESLRNVHSKHHKVNWKKAYEGEKLMGAAVEFRECPPNLTSALLVFLPNSNFKSLAISVMGNVINLGSSSQAS